MSIVVSNFQYAHFLPEAIDSALAQTEPCEVVVVDDGSTDGSRETIAAYGDLVIPVLKDNGGQASAFNAGFARCHGEVVIFLDADDTLRPEAARHALAATAPSSVVSVQWYLDIVDGDGRATGARTPSGHTRDDLRDRTLRRGPGSRLCPPASGLAWSRDFLERVMPIPETVRDAGAEPFLTDVAPLYGEVVSLSLSLSSYRVHQGSMGSQISTLTPKSLDRVLRAHSERRRALARHADVDPELWLRRNWRLLAVTTLLARLRGTGRQFSVCVLLRAAAQAEASAARRLVVAVFLIFLRLGPPRLVARVATRALHPRFL